MKKFMFLAVAMLGLVSCDVIEGGDYIQDVPAINFDEEAMTVEAAGAEELIITVKSTGLDAVTIRSGESIFAYWRAQSDEIIDMNIAGDGWMGIVEVIEEYNSGTRALPSYESAIIVRIAANETGEERQATITARSFTKSDTITITQSAE
ncbi:MAG: BACON domain-containing protein [Alistipes sp.]|nr:BACON domain-containing protein [Alistipes sp.]